MRKKLLLAGGITLSFGLVGCSVMMQMMGKGDMVKSLDNIDRMMPMMMKDPDKAMMYMGQQNKASVERGKALFSDTHTMGSNGRSCATCHPGGTTTGGMVEVPMRPQFKMKIPTLVGSAASFPKYKAPNDAVITLPEMAANCVRMFMGGGRLKLRDPRLRDLTAYVTTLSEGQSLKPAQ